MSNKVVVALDYSSVDEANRLIEKLTPDLCRLKIGKELFCLGGPQLVESIVRQGYDVFLDLKFHDIPNTVYSACKVVANLGVWMINVHCLGGKEMMQAAAEAVKATNSSVLLTGVTILTSMNEAAVAQVGLTGTVAANVQNLAQLALDSGLDGVVCSVHEASSIRAVTHAKFQLVTPGIRPQGSAQGDQKRAATPLQAIQYGANHLVIGRPITQAPDPIKALFAIADEIAQAKA